MQTEIDKQTSDSDKQIKRGKDRYKETNKEKGIRQRQACRPKDRQTKEDKEICRQTQTNIFQIVINR